MSYCQECGEQVAKEDVFCPFCGISIKPIAAVDDSLMSETIVNLPPSVKKKEVLDASKTKNTPDDPLIETTNEPLREISVETKSTENTENTVAFSSGNTSENWSMKTDSVEIPAEHIDQNQGIVLPIPQTFLDQEPKPIFETEPEEIKNEGIETPEIDELKGTVSTVEHADNFTDPPTPAIIQNQDFDYNAAGQTLEPLPAIVEDKIEVAELEDEISREIIENIEISEAVVESQSFTEIAQNEKIQPEIESSEPEKFEPVIEQCPIAEEIESPEAVIESTTNDESVQPLFDVPKNIADDNVFDSPVIPTDFVVESSMAHVSQSVSDESENIFVEDPKLEEPGQSVESKLEDNDLPTIENPIDETSVQPENNLISEEQPQSEQIGARIEMPAQPIELENHDEQSKFDSVKIIQKDEIQEADGVELLVETESVNSQTVEESPVSEIPDEPKEGRPFTTPNIGNADTDGRKAAKLKPLDEGVILNGRYEIVRKIGGGGMGAVYLANDRNLGGVLRAVKEMVQSYIESDQQDKAISDFKRESMLLTSLDHPAIPTIFDYFYDEKEARFYLVMKYISGGDLAGRLRSAPEGRIDEKSVTEWAIQISDVLEYLHNHEPSIVYRDLKPANVMIDGNSGRVMLIDFGIARWVNKEEKGVTAVGTMGYAPPELFSGNVEPRSDIYSLGSTIFHLLTGADPQSNPLLIFDFQKNPRPRQINSQLSDQIERILMRSVEYNAEMRFESAAHLRDELKEHLNNLQTGRVTYGVKAAPSSPAFSEQSVFCGFCGRQIVATDVFCAFCGAQQPIAQQSFSQPAIAVKSLTAKLVIQGTGELEPSSYNLDKTENLLGRRDPMSNIFPEVDLSKYDPQTKISRRHARIWRDGNNFLVEDLGSSNGTTLLSPISDSIRLLPHQPHNLTSGDKIRLGDTTLHFTVG